MRNGIGLLVGIGLIMVAFWVALRTSNQDTAPRPVSAVALATEYHSTPNLAPLPTATSTLLPPPSPTPLPLPTQEQIINWLFNTPSQSVYRVLPRRGIVIQAVHLYDTGKRQLVVTGDHAVFWMEGQALPAAFAAVLLDDHGRYTVKFAHLQLARQDAQVTLSMSPDNTDLQFTFQDIEQVREGETAIEHSYHVECLVDTCRLLEEH